MSGKLNGLRASQELAKYPGLVNHIHQLKSGFRNCPTTVRLDKASPNLAYKSLRSGSNENVQKWVHRKLPNGVWKQAIVELDNLLLLDEQGSIIKIDPEYFTYLVDLEDSNWLQKTKTIVSISMYRWVTKYPEMRTQSYEVQVTIYDSPCWADQVKTSSLFRNVDLSSSMLIEGMLQKHPHFVACLRELSSRIREWDLRVYRDQENGMRVELARDEVDNPYKGAKHSSEKPDDAEVRSYFCAGRMLITMALSSEESVTLIGKPPSDEDESTRLAQQEPDSIWTDFHRLYMQGIDCTFQTFCEILDNIALQWSEHSGDKERFLLSDTEVGLI